MKRERGRGGEGGREERREREGREGESQRGREGGMKREGREGGRDGLRQEESIYQREIEGGIYRESNSSSFTPLYLWVLN